MFSANSSQVSEDRLYVEDVFSTFLYTGTDATQAITNGIDLAGKGGLVWCKQRSSPAYNNALYDTARGVRNYISSNTTQAQVSVGSGIGLTAFNSNGFTLGADYSENASGATYASWTFRKAPKFFDVVTYTGNGVSGREIAHNLGVAPGCIIIKRTDTSVDWIVWHRGNGTTNYNLMALNLTDASTGSLSSGDLPTATTFKPGALLGPAYNSGNNTGGTYVAYLFAHDATSDGIIQCGSYTGTDANLSVTLGFEPQWILIKSASMSGDTYGGWHIVDNMRGLNNTLSSSSPPYLKANTSAAEATGNPNGIAITSTGFRVTTSWSVAPETYIYIAIRRGPMRTPTSGTSVFNAQTYTGDSSFDRMISTSTPAFPVDLAISRDRNTADIYWYWSDRLRGKDNSLYSNSDTFEDGGPYPYTAVVKFDLQTGLYASGIANNDSGKSFVAYSFKRAPSFFDITCYTGTGSNTTVSHNLRATPELIIVKRRNGNQQWSVYTASGGATKFMIMNTGGEYVDATYWNNVAPTSSVFTIGTNINVNSSGGSYVAYLFASAPGVSKVGSYTGNGTSQTIDCGFSGGARFVMIKRRDANGEWYVFDTARGIVAGNDPALNLNNFNPETSSSDAIDTNSTGFVVNSTGGIINISGATYLYLAVA